MEKNSQRRKSQAYLLIFLGWIVYTSSYLGKVNYSANITQIIDFYGITKAQAGTVPTFFFFAYGIGQVVNGLLCKKYNIKWMIFGSLTVSSIINFIIAVGSDFSIIKWLWMLNGFVLSILWPTLVRLLSESLPQHTLGTSSVVMGTTVAVGTLIIYGLSSIYAALGNFKLSFFTAFIVVFTIAIVWLIIYDRAVAASKAEKANDPVLEPEANATVKTENAAAEVKHGADDKKTFLVSVCLLCFCAIGVNLTKDGLTTWVPSILKEEFAVSDALSILLTLLLPIVAVFGNAFSLKMHKIIPDYINHCAAGFVAIAAFTGLIIGCLKFEQAVLMLLSLVIVNFVASSLNSLITSIFPLFMRGKVNSGLIAGILNGFCYVGSTISSYGLGAIADNFGWIYVFYTLIGFCGAAIIAWLCYSIFKASQRRRADN